MPSYKKAGICLCEVVVLTVVILAVWLIFFVPVISFFVLDDGSTSFMNDTLSNRTRTCNKDLITECNEDFFLDTASNQCRPHCEKWNLYSGVSEFLTFAVIGLSTALGLVTTVVILVLSFSRFRSMLKFPSVLVIYQNAAVSVYGTVVLVGLVDRSLFCTSPDLITSFNQRVTPLCAISGVLLIYAVLPLAIWVTIQIAFILVGVVFPFHAKRFLSSAWKRRTLHVCSLLLGLIFPLPTVILLQVKDYSLFGTTFPPVVCTPQRRDIMVFTWMIPLNTLLSVVVTMLILIFYKVVKSRGCFRQRNEPNRSGVTVEVKVLFITFSYILVGFVATISFAISSVRINRVKEEVFNYFECESCGISDMCSRNGFERLTNSALVTFAYSLFGLHSLITLVYVVNYSDVKGCFKKLWKRWQNRKSSTTTTMSQLPSEDDL